MTLVSFDGGQQSHGERDQNLLCVVTDENAVSPEPLNLTVMWSL